ncbi:hypothetical protein TNCV_4277431 [Trichonephila clavipes]|nr:hypothetical protein TNCV_4277431 [Trichonephila clavipes]
MCDNCIPTAVTFTNSWCGCHCVQNESASCKKVFNNRRVRYFYGSRDLMICGVFKDEHTDLNVDNVCLHRTALAIAFGCGSLVYLWPCHQIHDATENRPCKVSKARLYLSRLNVLLLTQCVISMNGVLVGP